MSFSPSPILEEEVDSSSLPIDYASLDMPTQRLTKFSHRLKKKSFSSIDAEDDEDVPQQSRSNSFISIQMDKLKYSSSSSSNTSASAIDSSLIEPTIEEEDCEDSFLPNPHGHRNKAERRDKKIRGKSIHFKLTLKEQVDLTYLQNLLKKYSKWYILYSLTNPTSNIKKSSLPLLNPKEGKIKKPKKKKLVIEDSSSSSSASASIIINDSADEDDDDKHKEEMIVEGMANSGKNVVRWTKLLPFILDKNGDWSFENILARWNALKRHDQKRKIVIEEWGDEPLFQPKIRNRQTEKKMTIQLLSKLPIDRIATENPEMSPWQFNQAYKAKISLDEIQDKKRQNSDFKFAHNIFKWQRQFIMVLNKAIAEEEDRRVIFLVDPLGGNGKTGFLSWLGSLPKDSKNIGKIFDRGYHPRITTAAAVAHHMKEEDSLLPIINHPQQTKEDFLKTIRNRSSNMIFEGSPLSGDQNTAGFQYLTIDVKRSDDMFYLIEPDTNKFIVDVAREEANSLSYAALEKLKSGVWNINKYEGKKAKYKNGQVIVAINEFPDRTKLSRDRYEVYLIHPSEKCLVYIPWEHIPKPNDPFCKTLIQQIIGANNPNDQLQLFNKFLTKILGQPLPTRLLDNLGQSPPPQFRESIRMPSSDRVSREPPHQINLQTICSNSKMEAKRTLLNSFIAPSHQPITTIPATKEEEESNSSSLDLEQLDQYFATQQELPQRNSLIGAGGAERPTFEGADSEEDDPFGSPDFDKMSDTPLIKSF